MKKISFICIIFLSFHSCKKDEDPATPTESQPIYFLFNGEIGTNDNSTLISSDDNLLICGNIGSNLSVFKITKSGTLIWRNDFEAGYYSSASGIAELNGEIFICGSTMRNNSASKTDVLLIKVNSTGDTIWTKTYGGIEADYGKNIIATSDGNILISGKTESFGAGTFGDLYLIKINNSGDTIWTASYPDQDQEVPFHLMETQNGEYLVTGTNEDTGQYRELYLLKVNANGQQVWNKKIGPPTWKWGFSTIELSNGDLLTCGKHTVNGYSNILIIKTDNTGNVIWENEYSINNISINGNSIKQNNDGSFSIIGSSFDVSNGQNDIIFLKIDENGNQLILKKFGSSYSDDGVNLIKDTNDYNIITGYLNGQIFMTRLNNNGEFE